MPGDGATTRGRMQQIFGTCGVVLGVSCGDALCVRLWALVTLALRMNWLLQSKARPLCVLSDYRFTLQQPSLCIGGHRIHDGFPRHVIAYGGAFVLTLTLTLTLFRTLLHMALLSFHAVGTESC